jgi:hypothetical protein
MLELLDICITTWNFSLELVVLQETDDGEVPKTTFQMAGRRKERVQWNWKLTFCFVNKEVTSIRKPIVYSFLNFKFCEDDFPDASATCKLYFRFLHSCFLLQKLWRENTLHKQAFLETWVRLYQMIKNTGRHFFYNCF